MATIKLSNNVLIDQGSIDGIAAIDTSNLLATVSSDYTAIQDCFAVQTEISAEPILGINGVSLQMFNKSSATGKASAWIMVKKDQTINTANRSTRIYGLKK